MQHLQVVVSVVVLGLALVQGTGRAAAHEHDLRIGVFEGNWCGLAARFDVKEKVGDTWVFKGRLYIYATGQYDEMTVKQYKDNHLRIVRHLSGAHAGTNQWADTHPPETMVRNGRFIVNFAVERASGYGAKVAGYLHMPKTK